MVAVGDVLQVEQPVVLVALVSKSKVDTNTVLGGGPDEVGHDAGDVEGQLPLRSLRHLTLLHRSILGGGGRLGLACSFSSIPPRRGRSLKGYLPLRFELLLPSRLEVRPLCELLHDLPRVPHATCHVQDGLVSDDVG